MATPDHWITWRHPAYETDVQVSTYAWDAYTGEAERKARVAAQAMEDLKPVGLGQTQSKDSNALWLSYAQTQGVGAYLYRREQGESPGQFKDRALISRYPMHFPALVASFVGSLNAEAHKTVRTWGQTGTPESGAVRDFWENADGAGTNFETMLTEIAVRFLVEHRLTYALLPPASDMEPPQLVFFDTGAVTNFLERRGSLQEITVMEAVDMRRSLQEKYAPEKHYVHYDYTGYTRYRIDEKGKRQAVSVVPGQSNEWSEPFYVSAEQERLRLPIRRLALPLKYNVGYRAARGNIYLYNLLSDARGNIRHANHAKLILENGDVNAFKHTAASIRAGSNLLLGPWRFDAPSAENAKVANDMYQEEVRDYYASTHNMYNNAPRFQTAVQTSTDENRGRTAFLALLAASLDEVENDIWYLFQQINRPADPGQWNDVTVERSRQFKPVDIERLKDQRTTRMQQWLSAGFDRRTALTEGADYTQEQADALLQTEARRSGEDVLEP